MPTADGTGGATSSGGSAYPILSSDWPGLSPYLIASFFPVRRVVEGTNVRWERIPGSTEVRAPLTDGQMESRANWSSPFEHQQADAKLSTFSSLMQAGGAATTLNSLQEYLPKDGVLAGMVDSANTGLQSLEGRTAVTKLNSTQIFTGMPPMNIAVTAHFRALYDPSTEVDQPMRQLMSWHLPKTLAQQGLVGNLVDQNQQLGWRTVYPSEAPQIIGMQYADMLIKPLVIESAPYPLTGQRNSNGKLVAGALVLSLATLAANDKDDWAGMFPAS